MSAATAPVPILNSNTLLYNAVITGDVVQLNAVLSRGVKVNQILHGISGNGTPIYLAAMSGHKDVVTALIKAGADVNNGTKDNEIPLGVAVEKKQFRNRNNTS